MEEPKRFEETEARHWMIDHPGDQMWHEGESLRRACRYNGALSQFQVQFSDEWILAPAHIGMHIYVRSEFDAWQAEIRAKIEEMKGLDPREGESLPRYLERNFYKEPPLDSFRQRWIESYVRRAIRSERRFLANVEKEIRGEE